MFESWGVGLALVVVPYSFLYGVVSRLPMIYAMVHMKLSLQLTGMVPACLFASYCLGRLLGASFTSSLFGIYSMMIGTCSGVVSHAGILAAPANPFVFGAMIFVAGFTETVTGINIIMKLECILQDIPKQAETRVFRCHFVFVTAGAVGAYTGGGALYDHFGIESIAWTGLACSAGQMLIIFAYGASRWHVYHNFVTKAEDVIAEAKRTRHMSQTDKVVCIGINQSTGAVTSNGPVGFPPGGVDGRRRSVHEIEKSLLPTGSSPVWNSVELQDVDDVDVMDLHEGLPDDCEDAHEKIRKSTRDMRTSFSRASRGKDACINIDAVMALAEDSCSEGTCNTQAASKQYKKMSRKRQHRVDLTGWTIVLSYFITAFPIGQNFALMTLYWKSVWGKDTAVSGLIMSLGEVLGILALIPLANKFVFESPVFASFRRPMNLVVSCGMSSAMVALAIAPNIYASACGCVSIHVVNVMLHTFCNEICAAWIPPDTYAKWTGRCYLAKRLSNTTIAFASTAMFTFVGVRESFIMVSGIVGAWTFVLAYVFWSCELMPWQTAHSKKQRAVLEEMAEQHKQQMMVTSSAMSDIERLIEVLAVSRKTNEQVEAVDSRLQAVQGEITAIMKFLKAPNAAGGAWDTFATRQRGAT